LASVQRAVQSLYSQTCVQRPPLGPEKRGRYADVYMKKISGKKASGWPLGLQTGRCWQVAVIQRWPLGQVWLYKYVISKRIKPGGVNLMKSLNIFSFKTKLLKTLSHILKPKSLQLRNPRQFQNQSLNSLET
jgi:hypothetical protein